MNNTDRHAEEQLDVFIRSRLRLSSGQREVIEPSPDFTARTMELIMQAERRQQITQNIIPVAVSLLPLIFQEIWILFIREDKFSVSQWPMGAFVSDIYQLAISSTGTALLALMGAGLFFFYRVFYIPRMRSQLQVDTVKPF